MIDTIGFDGDDTLWHNENLFSITQAHFRSLLAHAVTAEELDRHLLDIERRNLALYGYGVKGFILSMIETAVQVTNGRITGRKIRSLLDFSKGMLSHPVELLPGVEDVLGRLAPDYRLVLITKGELFEQESKIARSGLAERFSAIEIISEKDTGTYRRILERYGVAPDRFLMVGNSIRSDILPVLALGAHAVHIPYHLLWAHEEAEPPEAGFHSLDSLSALPGLLAAWDDPG